MKNYRNNKGFTLIELMVATTLFVVIMLAAMSSLFMLLDESKSSRALRLAMDNVNFAMDSMTRSIRMGTIYSGGGTNISFKSQDNKDVKYQLVTKSDGKGNTIEKCISLDCVSIISPDVNIDVLNFFLRNTSGIQPSVYIIMKGTVKVKGVPTSFAIQTMASQRNF